MVDDAQRVSLMAWGSSIIAYAIMPWAKRTDGRASDF